jgi:DNA-binding response OmpR family regulator
MHHFTRAPSNLRITVAGQHEVLVAQLRRLGFAPTLTKLEALDGERRGCSAREVFIIVCPELAHGVRIVRDMRVKQQEAGIMVAARDLSTQVEVALLEAGADRCLPLPSDNLLLRASINAIVRRLLCDWSPDDAGVHLGPEAGALRIGSRVVELRKTEYQLCEYLVLNRGRWVAERELLENVLRVPHERETSLVRVHIRNIRQALGDLSECLISRRGRGYQFCAPATAAPRGDQHSSATLLEGVERIG